MKRYVFGVLYPTEKDSVLDVAYVFGIRNVKTFLNNMNTLTINNKIVNKKSTPEIFIQYAEQYGIKAFTGSITIKK